MVIDPRDAIWNEAHELRYYASYAEQIEYSLLARWSWLDGVTKVAVAATSTGSALASLALWRDPQYASLWPWLMSVSALLAIVSKQLEVGQKIRDHTMSATELGSLSVDIGTLIVRMKVNPEFPIGDFEKKLIALREKYKAEARKFSRDMLLTTRLAFKTLKGFAAAVPPIPMPSIPERNGNEIR